MKIVVIGGSGLIGAKLVEKLRVRGHEVVPASPRSGVNAVTGEGLAQAMRNAAVVVDVSNSPSFEEKAVMDFFTASTRNLLDAEANAGVGHHVALSVVGTDRMQQSPYFRAKNAQEKLIRESPVPYSIVRATQFFEFGGAIADSATSGGQVRLTTGFVQPIAADDVAAAMERVAIGAPVHGIKEVGGPERFPLDEFVRTVLRARNDARKVLTDEEAGYFGMKLDRFALVPGEDAELGEIRFEDWLESQRVRSAA